jgi:hypothetical protein
VRASRPRRTFVLGLLCGLWMMGGCDAASPQPSTATGQEPARMQMTIGDRRFTVVLADTDAARAFATRLPLTLDMAELNGNEKHADIHPALPVDARRPGTIHAGDVMLYGASTIVVFYKTFPSSYRYTRLGRVQNNAGLQEALGPGDAQVVFAGE